MATLTIRLSDEKHERLCLTELEAETRFRTRASRGSRKD